MESPVHSVLVILVLLISISFVFAIPISEDLAVTTETPDSSDSLIIAPNITRFNSSEFTSEPNFSIIPSQLSTLTNLNPSLLNIRQTNVYNQNDVIARQKIASQTLSPDSEAIRGASTKFSAGRINLSSSQKIISSLSVTENRIKFSPKRASTTTAKSTTITISGLDSNARYSLCVDNCNATKTFSADSSGKYSYNQDISKQHDVNINKLYTYKIASKRK